MIHAINVCHSMFNISLKPHYQWHIPTTDSGVAMIISLLHDRCMERILTISLAHAWLPPGYGTANHAVKFIPRLTSHAITT